MSPSESECRAAFELSGFNEEETGGGCTAWVLALAGGREVLVTDGDLAAPLSLRKRCLVSMVAPDGEVLVEEWYCTAEEFLDALDAECEKTGETVFQLFERYGKVPA